jgi:hypothetical protein
MSQEKGSGPTAASAAHAKSIVRGRRLALALAGLLVALEAFPGMAEANGPGDPVATSYLAKITFVPAGLDAKVVDGDLRLWLRVARDETAVVLDYARGPYLRFSRYGVDVNADSAIYYLNQTPAEIPPAKVSPIIPPQWQHVSGGHDYLWHDGRLQALAQARPIGRGPRFDPPVSGAVTGRCRRQLGARKGVHIELFAADRVVILAEGIDTRPPRVFSAGRLSRARCYGDLVTIDPTGVVLVRPRLHLNMSELFRAWGQPLSRTRLASFSTAAGRQVAVYVDGRPWSGSPRNVPLTAHAEIVLEVGPHVPPHITYMFPPGT